MKFVPLKQKEPGEAHQHLGSALALPLTLSLAFGLLATTAFFFSYSGPSSLGDGLLHLGVGAGGANTSAQLDCAGAGAPPHAPFLCSNKVAVMVEPRDDPNVVVIVDNFASHLPLDWRLQLFVSNASAAAVRAAPVLRDWVAAGRILLQPAPVINQYPQDYNRLIESEPFWKSIVGEHVLIFQTDTVLCRRSPHKIDDFLKYDYVGAPWNMIRHCGNGGLSLRSREKSLIAITKAPSPPDMLHEDGWFCDAMNATTNGAARLAPPEVAKTFSSESIFYDRPLGVHKFWDHAGKNEADRRTLYSHCPEAMLILPKHLLPRRRRRLMRRLLRGARGGGEGAGLGVASESGSGGGGGGGGEKAGGWQPEAPFSLTIRRR